MGMTVDFNNLRVNAATAYNELVGALNRERTGRGLVKIYEEDLEGPLSDLRAMIGAIMCVYEKDNKEFRDVSMDVELMRFDTIEDGENEKR